MLISSGGPSAASILFAFGIASILGLAASPAAADVWSHCYTPTNGTAQCFDSLALAEAAMRADHDEGELLVQDYISATGSGASAYQRTHYRVPDQPPESYSAPAYFVGNGAYCAERSSYDPTGCATEAGATEGWFQSLKSTSSCTMPDTYYFLGQHETPYHRTSNPSGGYSAAVSYGSGEGGGGHARTMEIDATCPSGPTHYSYVVAKQARLYCKNTPYWTAAGAYAPGHAPNSTYAEVDESQVCRYRGSKPNITSKLMQVACPSGNCHPMYPGTGDKARFETDLVFAGRPFVRTYHSLMAGPQATMAQGWRHSYSDVRIGTTPRRFLRDDGYIDTFDAVGSGLYRSKSDPNRTLRESGGLGYITEADGFVKVFNGARLIRAYHSAQPQYAMEFTYDGNGRLATITDAQGRTLTLVYSYAGIVMAVQTSGGEDVIYGYDAVGNLATVTYADGTQRRYHYGEAGYASPIQIHHLTGITDENGDRYATFGYDSRGRAILSQLHTGDPSSPTDSRTTMSYAGEYTVTLTRAAGEVVTYGILPGTQRRTQTLAEGDGTTTNGYDTSERLTQRTSKAGVVTTYGYVTTYMNSITEAVGTPEERRRLIERDGNQQVVSSTVQRKQAGSFVTEAVVKSPTDANGRATATCVVDPDSANAAYVCGSQADAPSGVRQTSFTYCTATDVTAANSTCPILGLLKTVNGPLAGAADTTTYEYRAATDLTGCGTQAGFCHRKGDLWRITDGFGRETIVQRYDLGGRVEQVRDANAVVADFTYDPRGRMTARSVRGPDATTDADDAITRLEYDDVGEVKKVTPPDGAYLTFDYDHAHRLTGIEDALGNTITYRLDGAGNRFEEETRDVGGVLRQTLARVFNQLGDLQTAADAYANPTDFTYDAAGRVDTVTDALGRTSDNDYDALGRLRQSIANVAGSGGERAVSMFDYDALDRLTAVVDPKGLTTQYVYDGLGNLAQLQSPDTGTTSYGHDAAGNRTSTLDARGIATSYVYDRLNRLTLIDVPTAGQDVTLDYDTLPAACQAEETFSIGRLSAISDPSGSTTYCHDRRGNIVRKVQAVTGGPSGTVGYSYNTADRLVAMTYPSGATVAFGRDTTGRINGIVAQPTPGSAPVTLVSAVEYAPFGPLSQLTFGNGRQLDRAHDLNYGIDAVTDSAADGVAIDVGLDDVGNVTALDERLKTGTVANRVVEYDGLDRLAALKDGSTTLQGFSYDATGNRLQKVDGGTENYSYESTSHRLTQTGAVVRTHDAAGHGTGIGAKTFTYDDHGRRVQTLDNGVLAHEYRYNGRGERVAKLDTAAPENDLTFVYDEAGHLIGEYRPDGSRVREFVWMDDVPVAVMMSTGTTHYYIASDHLNTPRAVIQPSTNTIVWRWDLTGSAFGEHAVDNDPDGDGVVFNLALRYPGQYYDGETGTHYNYFRDYDPATGRYLQSDPIGLAGGLSTYGYVGSTPLGFSDPFGLKQWHGSISVSTDTLSHGNLLWAVAYAKQHNATVNIHSECFWFDGLFGKQWNSYNPLIRGTSAELPLDTPDFDATFHVRLNDPVEDRLDMPATSPDPNLLRGQITISATVANGQITRGTVHVGAAEGWIPRGQRVGLKDGTYNFTAEAEFSSFSEQTGRCNCPEGD